jgi:hypothetical protein
LKSIFVRHISNVIDGFLFTFIVTRLFIKLELRPDDSQDNGLKAPRNASRPSKIQRKLFSSRDSKKWGCTALIISVAFDPSLAHEFE